MNDSLPFEVSADPFEKSLRGMFGRFATNESYKLNYVLSSIPISHIDNLDTATEAFDISKIDFEQLIQRDIDFKRVENIAENYLENGKNRVIFFPPLLVSLVSLKEGNILDKYTAVDASPDSQGKNFVQTWDKDKFQLILPISKDITNTTVIYNKTPVYIYNFGAVLKYNPQTVRLVVIDGQHRLTALKHLAKSNDDQRREVVKSVEIPICIVFSPDAMESGENGETISNDLRELFVTINTQGKKVSGHFITLLDDNSLSAIAVRDLADKWKTESLDGYARLHLLEWNQREHKLAYTRQRKYSVSTVSILGDCLKEHLFEDSLNTANILNLMSVSTELTEIDGSIAVDEICEDAFRPKQVEILKGCIRRTVTPALDILFRKSRPYFEIEQKFNKSCKWLNDQIAANKRGASAFKADVLLQYRGVNSLDLETTREVGAEFIENLKEGAEEYDEIFFLNVFQQALIRSWITLSIKLNEFEIAPKTTALALAPALDIICFNKEKALFDFKRQFTQKTLYNGERLIVTKKSKELWTSLLLATLANAKVCSKLLDGLNSKETPIAKDALDKIKEKLTTLGREQAAKYLNDFKDASRKDYEKNWREKELGESLLAELTKLSESPSEESRAKFDERITKLVDEKLESSAERLSNVLEVPKENLFAK